MRALPIVSVGYEGRTPAELVALLHAHDVEKVIDVRELPLSRRKGFSKTPLSNTLKAAGILYQHVRAAGNPHRHLKSGPAASLAMYARHLAKHPEVLSVVSTAVDGSRAAVLCFERAHEACHRSRLLDALTGLRRNQYKVVRVE